MNNNEVLKEKEFSEDDYRSVRNMLAALAEKVIWRHKTLCESEEDTTITAIANQFVQAHGDAMLLDMIEKMQKIYRCYTQRYQLIVKVNGDPFQTAMFSYLNIEECLDAAQNYVDLYDGNHDFAIIDTNLETRKVYGNEEVRSMLKPKAKHYFWVASSDDSAYEDRSDGLFTDKRECYDDMRDAALEKMKWNTQYNEDFYEPDDYIGYKVRFSKNTIVHDSYSGSYTYQIFCLEDVLAEPEKFYFSKYCQDMKIVGDDIRECLRNINKDFLAV